MSEVTDALRGLQAGERTIEEVEQMFRTRSWPARPVAAPKDGAEAIARDSADPEEPPEGSFFEVADAFSKRIIDVDTYERLATAASEAISGSSPASTAPADQPAEPESAVGEQPEGGTPPEQEPDDEEKDA